jgi:large subunit ribosomal protein L31
MANGTGTGNCGFACHTPPELHIIQGFAGRIRSRFQLAPVVGASWRPDNPAAGQTPRPWHAGAATQEVFPMKDGIHPDYREVVFQDMASDFRFITRSTVSTREKITLDGKEYPLFKLDVSSESHPFYTGAQQRVNEAGRVEKFRQKFARSAKTG